MSRVIFMLILSLLLSAGAFAAPAGKSVDKTVTLNVSGMTCSLCPITVRKALEGVPGVEKVSVNFPARTVRVEYAAARTSVAALLKATANAGYPATLKDKPAHE